MPRPAQPAPTAAELPTTRTLIERVHRDLKANIINGQRKPGERLLIDELRARHGVSSSTIREALLLLVGDGLVLSEGQRGFRVAPISLAEFREIITLRKMMESAALRQSIAAGDDNWESGVVAALHKLNLIETRGSRRAPAVAREWSERNHAFHEALLAGSHSRWLKHFRRILYQNSERYRVLSMAVFDIRPEVREEHKAIMDAALARNADRACRLLEEHIERTFVGFSKIPAHLLDSGKAEGEAPAKRAPVVKRRRNARAAE
jgi:GntR family transcriptional regulator, carbon starvation induced regulator